VLRARNGKTIEVMNTDAEGRLVLADGLSLAAEEEPDLVVDLATLTGACMVALGEKIAGLFGTGEAPDRVREAAEAAGERVWPMPMPEDYRKLIDSDVADMKNSGPRYGGAINAALLLKEFVGDVPWAHLDIAGPARSTEAEHYVQKGGTGFGVRTVVELAERLSASG
jgi:leucyl aminopeptidase